MVARFVSAVMILLLLTATNSPDVFAQNDIKPILQKLKYYRFGNIWVLKLRPPNLSTVKKLLVTDPEAEEDADVLKKLEPSILRAVQSAVRRGRTFQGAVQQLERSGVKLTPDIEKAINYELGKKKVTKRIEDVYLVTTRAKQGETPVIISLIQSTKGKDRAEDNLRSVAPTDILTVDELKAFELDSSYGADNLYDYVENAIVQGAVTNVTPEIQGLDKSTIYPQVFGIAEAVESNSADMSSEDVARYLRISNGEPENIYNQNLVVAGLDVISYRRYEDPYAGFGGDFADDADDDADADDDDTADDVAADDFAPAFNNYLPKYGVELKYGIDEINYPSLWAERVALNAIWSSVKLGIILPTGGWSSLSGDLGADRKLTHGGFGINGNFDFPFKVVPRSGVFNASFGYVFGDAEPATYKDRELDPFVFQENLEDGDYFIRMNARLHYTFAVSVDEDHLFRFGLGGTMYRIEYWTHRAREDANLEPIVEFEELEDRSETRGGISGLFEFMKRNTTTPWGVSVQYYDEAVWGNIWLHIPVTPQIGVRIDTRGYVPVLRDEHVWEAGSVLLPSLRFIYNW